MALRLTKENFDNIVSQAELPVLVDFYKDGCVPCRRMAPVLSRVEAEYEGKLQVGRVNLTQNQELTEQYEITAAPTFLLFMDGKERARFHGVTKEDELKAAIEKVL